MQSFLFTLADVAAGPALYVAGGAMFVTILLLIVLVEAIVLRLMRYSRFGRSLLHALIANLVSALFGIAAVALGASPESLFGSVAGLAVAWAVSVVVEGGILLLFKCQPARRIWALSLAANAVNYLLLAGFVSLSK